MGHPDGGANHPPAAHPSRLPGDNGPCGPSPRSSARRRVHIGFDPLRPRNLSRGVAVAVHRDAVRGPDDLCAHPPAGDAAARLSAARLQSHHRDGRGREVHDRQRRLTSRVRSRAERRAGEHARNILRNGRALESALPPGSSLRALAAGTLGIHAAGARRIGERGDSHDCVGRDRAARSILRYQELRGARGRQDPGAPRRRLPAGPEDLSRPARWTAAGRDQERHRAGGHSRCRGDRRRDQSGSSARHCSRFAGALHRAHPDRQHSSHRFPRLSQERRRADQAIAPGLHTRSGEGCGPSRPTSAAQLSGSGRRSLRGGLARSGKPDSRVLDRVLHQRGAGRTLREP